ncbi:hypothetical protein PoB_004785700 [Plakobranchus ocellatus]|uniref:Uncharacterized protein n=1 Tax=Plakobranchus ocellatus TaxID=259542 RepID=A0AAV4BPQ6_9GAST|nr:hypothetical protein PoB_004785700 [Plakobranchus ocellatus]
MMFNADDENDDDDDDDDDDDVEEYEDDKDVHDVMMMMMMSIMEFHNKVISGFQALRQAGGAGGGCRARDRRVHADLRADSLATVPPMPQRVTL